LAGVGWVRQKYPNVLYYTYYRSVHVSVY
jgi:hypothetical protein